MLLLWHRPEFFTAWGDVWNSIALVTITKSYTTELNLLRVRTWTRISKFPNQKLGREFNL